MIKRSVLIPSINPNIQALSMSFSVDPTCHARSFCRNVESEQSEPVPQSPKFPMLPKDTTFDVSGLRPKKQRIINGNERTADERKRNAMNASQSKYRRMPTPYSVSSS